MRGHGACRVWCDISIDLYDQFGNSFGHRRRWRPDMDTTNGNYSEIDQKYFPDHVGVWWLNLTSVSGAMDELQITVGHGAIDYLELNVSRPPSLLMTAFTSTPPG